MPESLRAKILLQKREMGFDLRFSVPDDEVSPRSLKKQRKRRHRNICLSVIASGNADFDKK